MSQLISRKSFFQQGLAVAVTALMMTSANAASDAEVKQLREEVQALKALVQQQQQIQQQQQVILADVKVQPAIISPLAGLKSKNGANVNLYGFVRGDANYIIEGADDDFNKVSATNGEAKDKLRATAKTTRIGLDFDTPVGDAKVGGKVEVDFAGNGASENLRIRHAYLTYNNW